MFPNHKVSFIFYTDEKIFTDSPTNMQNNRVDVSVMVSSDG